MFLLYFRSNSFASSYSIETDGKWISEICVISIAKEVDFFVGESASTTADADNSASSKLN